MRKNRMRAVSAALFAVALTALGFAGSASAKLTGVVRGIRTVPMDHKPKPSDVFTRRPKAANSSSAIKKVPIVNQVTLQGRLAHHAGDRILQTGRRHQRHHALQRRPAGPGRSARHRARSSSPPLVKALIKFFFENSLTGVNSTLELAKPAK